MAPKALDFKCALVTGGGGGIGKALAEYFISLGKKVVIAGRTESNLKDAAAELGHGTAYYVLDTGKVADIPDFVAKVTAEHPELDCLVNNAGVQRPLDFADFDLAKADQEIDINQRGPMHLAVGLLPHFKAQPGGGVLVNVSSVLGYVPFSIINPNYNGTKAWVHFFTMAMRTQLRAQGAAVRVVEIAPPSVGTALHRDRADPDDNKKDKNPTSLTLEEFMDEVRAGFEADEDTITAGPGKKMVGKWYEAFGETYAEMGEAKYKP